MKIGDGLCELRRSVVYDFVIEIDSMDYAGELHQFYDDGNIDVENTITWLNATPDVDDNEVVDLLINNYNG